MNGSEIFKRQPLRAETDVADPSSVRMFGLGRHPDARYPLHSQAEKGTLAIPV